MQYIGSSLPSDGFYLTTMQIHKTTGHNKKGKVIELYYGTFKIKGERINETIMTNNYKTKVRAVKELTKLMDKYKSRLL